MSDKNVIIKDVEGDDLLVTWDLVRDDDQAVVMLDPLRSRCSILDARGVRELRAALDRAEAAQGHGTTGPASPSEDEALRVYEQAFSGSNHKDRASRRRDGIRATLDLIRSRTSQPDAPIADPAERAQAVARELRRRGIFACVQGGGVTVSAEDKAFWYHLAFDGVAALGPRAIADRIQREEARRAAAWAGDTEES